MPLLRCLLFSPMYLWFLLALQRQKANKRHTRHTDKILFYASHPKLKMYKTGPNVQFFNPRTWEARTRGSEVQDHSRLQSKLRPAWSNKTQSQIMRKQTKSILKTASFIFPFELMLNSPQMGIWRNARAYIYIQSYMHAYMHT